MNLHSVWQDKWFGASDWVSAPLWALFDRVKETGHAHERFLSVSRDKGVHPRTDGDPTADDRGVYQLVDRGWLVVNRMQAWRGASGIAFDRGIVSGHYIVFRPHQHGHDPRFLNFLVRSDPYTELFASLSRGVRPNQPEIDNDWLRSVPLLFPPLVEQRRIADFLDNQVTRIDALIAMRGAQNSVLAQSSISLAHHLIAPLGRSGAPLSSVAKIVDTEHRTAPDSEIGGYFIAGTNAIRNGHLVQGALREIDQWAYLEWTRRARPRIGDIFLTREAPIGHVCLLTSEGMLPAVGQRVVLIRASEFIDPEFLRLVLMSPVLLRLVSDAAAGSLHPHLNMSDIARLRVPTPELTEQQTLGSRFTEGLSLIATAETAVQRSLDLYAEYKRSLITAAVTGEFDVSAASGRGVPA